MTDCDFCDGGNRQQKWWCFWGGDDVGFAVFLDDGGNGGDDGDDDMVWMGWLCWRWLSFFVDVDITQHVTYLSQAQQSTLQVYKFTTIGYEWYN